MVKRLVSTTLSDKVHTLGPLRCAAALKLENNADQEGTHPFTRQFHIQTVLLAKVLEEGTHDLERHTREP